MRLPPLFFYIAIGFGLTASMAFAGHDGSAGKSEVGEGQGIRAHRHEKPTLAVGAGVIAMGALNACRASEPAVARASPSHVGAVAVGR